MEDLFKTFKIKFTDRDDFNKAVDMNNLADDIGHSDMIFIYSKKYFRDRFAGYLSTMGITNWMQV